MLHPGKSPSVGANEEWLIGYLANMILLFFLNTHRPCPRLLRQLDPPPGLSAPASISPCHSSCCSCSRMKAVSPPASAKQQGGCSKTTACSHSMASASSSNQTGRKTGGQFRWCRGVEPKSAGRPIFSLFRIEATPDHGMCIRIEKP